MQFLTDENIPTILVKAIRARGYFVKDVKEESLIGLKDGAIMALARDEERVIITLDKDFTTYPLKNHYGVVVLRYSNKNAYNLTERFCYFLDSPLKDSLNKNLCELFDTYIKIHKR